MAEGFLKSLNPGLAVYSAGTKPELIVNPNAITVMSEIWIDISENKPKNVELFLSDTFDYVITVCDDAKETCPNFTGCVIRRLHIGFEDPAKATGTYDEILNVYRQIRDEIRTKFLEFYKDLKI